MSKFWQPPVCSKQEKKKNMGLTPKQRFVKSLYDHYLSLITMERDLTVLTLGDDNMALDQVIVDLIKKFDDATTAVATRLQKLIDAAAATGSVTSAEIAAALQPEVDKLTAMGTDPANPV